MKGIKRLTPIVPGEMQPLLWIDDTIKVGFMSGGATDGRGFPQWAHSIFGSGSISHYFLCFDAFGVSTSLCGRLDQHYSGLFLPGNYARCKDCEKRYTKALRSGRPA